MHACKLHVCRHVLHVYGFVFASLKNRSSHHLVWDFFFSVFGSDPQLDWSLCLQAKTRACDASSLSSIQQPICLQDDCQGYENVHSAMLQHTEITVTYILIVRDAIISLEALT